ncbi:MAG: peptidylprolyl isomerase [Patescibacteria group bacterium]|nr:peptidylprolyl isomerase [Patescibacteria group bacterium]
MANIQKTLKRLKPDVRKWSKRTKVFAGVVAVLVLLYLVYAVILYTTGGNDSLTRFVSNFAYYPAAKVFAPGFWPYYLGGLVATAVLLGAIGRLCYLFIKGRTASRQTLLILVGLILVGGLNLTWLPSPSSAAVGYGTFLDRVATFKKIQSAQQQAQGVTSQQDEMIKPFSLQQLIQQRLVQQAATKLNVSVSDKKVDEAYKEQAQRVQGEKEFKRLLKERLGWSPREYKQELRTNVLLQEALNEKISSDENLNKGAKDRADQALKALKDGKSFAAVAKQYSEDPTATKGGDQGTLKRGQLDPAIEKEAFSLKVGSVSDVIKARQGFVIIKVESRSKNSVRIRQVLVLGKSISTYFQEILPKTKVWVLVDGLKWDKALFTVQSTNPQPPQVQPQPGAGASGAPAPAKKPAKSAK